jgi:hypothetical protein
MTIQAAPTELLDLAAAMRPDWDRDQLSLALVAARNAGWTWTRTLTATVRLLCDVKAVPRDLAVAARSPLERTVPADPDVAAAALAEMRATVEHAGGAA